MSTHHNEHEHDGRDDRQYDGRDDNQYDDRDDDQGDGDQGDGRGGRDGRDGRDHRDGSGRYRSVAPSYPDASPVGEHLVVDKTEWVPGRHPETHLEYEGQRGYTESYYRCIRCGTERLTRREFPDECEGPT